MSEDDKTPIPETGKQKAITATLNRLYSKDRRRSRAFVLWTALSVLFVTSVAAFVLLHPQPAKNFIYSIMAPECKALNQEQITTLSVEAVGIAYLETAAEADKVAAELFDPIYARIPEYVEYRFSYKYRFIDKPVEMWNSLWEEVKEKGFIKLMGADWADRVTKVENKLNKNREKNFRQAFLTLHPCPNIAKDVGAQQHLKETAKRLGSRAILSPRVLGALLDQTKFRFKKHPQAKKFKWLKDTFKALRAEALVRALGGGAKAGGWCSPGGPVVASGCAVAGSLAIWAASDALFIIIEKGLTKDDMTKIIKRDIKSKEKALADELKRELKEQMKTSQITFKERAKQYRGG